MERKASNIVWHQAKITKEDRHRLNNHKSCVLWFTGLSASGKSTLATEVERELYNRGIRTYVLDGDNIRHGLNKDLGFSPEDRKENIRRIGEVAKLFVDSGLFALTAFISPYREDRDMVRSMLQEGEFIEIYVKCPLEVCESRDPKGLYKKARAGEIKDFTGISAPYEEPLNPELMIETDKQTIEESVQQVVGYLRERGYIV
jgi:adenylylsulfate kinase